MALTHPFGIQIYSARNFPPLEAQMATLAQAGFTNIETFGPLYENAAETRRLMDKYGLTARSGHFSVDMVETQPERTLDVAQTLGVELIVAPYLPPQLRPADAVGWKALGARLARCRDVFGARGLRFAWHNHDFEFVTLPDGSFPIEHVLGAELMWEADLAWVKRGGGDPAFWLERYRGRIPAVHVKDLAYVDGRAPIEDGWADVGAGAMGWAALWKACVEAGAELMIAEHDNPSDFARFANVSARAMRAFAEAAK